MQIRKRRRIHIPTICLLMAACLAFGTSAAFAAGDGDLTVVITKPVDVALAVGDTTQDMSNFEADLLTALSDYEGTYGKIDIDDINVMGIDAMDVGTDSNFSWMQFDHTNGSRNISGNLFLENVNQATAQNSSNAYNSKVRHIDSTDNGSKLTFYGYGTSPYADFMLLENTQRTTKTFNFAIKEYFAADALGGMGFFVNSNIHHSGTYGNAAEAYNASQLFLDGYLVFFAYNGYSATGINVYKVQNLNLYSLHGGSISSIPTTGFTQIASLSVNAAGPYKSTDDLRKFRIVAKPSTLEIYYAGFDDTSHAVSNITNESSATPFNTNNAGYLAFTAAKYQELPALTFNLSAGGTASTIPLDASFVQGGSFGPMTKFNAHSCGSLTKVELSELSMSMDRVRSLVEVMREPQWGEDTDRFIVYVNDSAIGDFTNSTATGELLNRLYDENIYYVGWASQANASDSEAFLNAGPGGVVINRSQEGVTYQQCIQATAKAIYDRYWTLYAQRNNTVVIGEDVHFGGDDAEDTADTTWPDGKWYVTYDNNGYFGYETATHAGSRQFISNINDFDFSKPGIYEIYYQYDIAKDDGGNAGNLKETLKVHRPPVAAFDAAYADGSFTLSDRSFDPDTVSAFNQNGDNGITTAAFTVKDVTGGANTSVPVTGNTFSAASGHVYLVSLDVADKDGGTATATRQIAASEEQTRTPVPYANFSIGNSTLYKGLSGHDTLSLIDKSSELYGGALTYTYSVTNAANAILVTEANAPALPASIDVSTWAPGVYTVNLTVKSGTVTSSKVARTFTIVDEPAPVLTLSAKAGGGSIPSGYWSAAPVAITLGTTAPVPSGVTYYYSTDGGANWLPVVPLSGTLPTGLSWNALNHAFTISEGVDVTYSFKTVSGAGKDSNIISHAVNISTAVPTLSWTFSGGGFDSSAAPSPATDQWYGAMTVTAQGVPDTSTPASPIRKNSISASLSGMVKGSDATTGAAPEAPPIRAVSVTLTDPGVYTVSAETTNWNLLGSGVYCSAGDIYVIRIDPAIDTFLTAASAVDQTSTYGDLLRAMTVYTSMSTTQKDHIGKNAIAAAALSDLQTRLAAAGGEVSAAFAQSVADADTLAEYQALKPLFDALSADQKSALGVVLEEYNAKQAELAHVQEALAAIDKANDADANYRDLQLAVGNYAALTPAEQALLAEGDPQAATTIPALIVDKNAIDAVAALIDGIQEPYTADALTDIEAASDYFNNLTSEQQAMFPDHERGTLHVMEEEVRQVNNAQGAINALDDASTPEEIEAARIAYQNLPDALKGLVTPEVNGTPLDTVLENKLQEMEAANAARAATIREALPAAEFIERVFANPNRTPEDIADAQAQYDQLSPDAKAALPASAFSHLQQMNADAAAVSGLIDDIRNGVNGPYADRIQNANPPLSLEQKSLIDAATGGQGSDYVASEPVQTLLESLIISYPDSQSPSILAPQAKADIEKAMKDYLNLPQSAKALIPQALVAQLQELYDALIGQLHYINTGRTADSRTTVTVVGLANNVTLPADAGADPDYSTIIELTVKDEMPVIEPVHGADMDLALSIDVTLIATVYDTSNNAIIASEEIQPEKGKPLSILVELPTGYQSHAMEIYHVKLNGISERIWNYAIVTVGGRDYALITLTDLSYILVYLDHQGGNPPPPPPPAPPKSSERPHQPVAFDPIKPEAPAQPAGLPYYYEGNRIVFVGVSFDPSGEMRWIAPEGKTILFMPNPKNFLDIAASSAITDINMVTERELFIGVSENVFAPDAAMTRAMFITVLGRLHESSFGSLGQYSTSGFADVDGQTEYRRYIAWAKKSGIVLGESEARFAPDRSITSAEMTAIFARYTVFAGIDESAGIAAVSELPGSALKVTRAEAAGAFARFISAAL